MNHWQHRCCNRLGVGLLFGLILGCAPADPEPVADDTGGSSEATVAAATSPNADPSAATAEVGSPGGTVALPGSDEVVTATLGLGDPAPPIEVSQWLRGESIASFKDGQIYVIEFWATWCPPCRDSMPHLSELQKAHADEVHFVGISDETEEVVESFLKNVQDPSTGVTWDDVVSYRLAIDPQRNMQHSYMQAAKQSGIPTAFVVGRDGRIEWIGHPLEIDDPLKKIVSGNWDRAAAQAAFANKAAAQEAAATLQVVLRRAQLNGDFATALAELDKFLERFPERTEFKLTKFQLALEAKDFAVVNALATELAEEHWQNSQVLGGVAWALATAVPAAERDLDEALRLATRASSLADDSDADKLDTLARVYFEMGNRDKAVELQRKAVELNGEAESLRQALDRYEAADDS